MTNETEKIIWLAYLKSWKNGEFHPEIVEEMLKKHGIKITDEWKNALNAIYEKAQMASTLYIADIFNYVSDAVQDAKNNGTDFHDWINNFGDKFRKEYSNMNGKPNRHLQTVLRTNTQIAYMAGRYEGMKETAKSFPYWQFLAVTDSRTTDECRAFNGKVFRYDDPFWKSNYPPRHFNCRSSVRSLSESDLKEEGLKVSNGRQSAPSTDGGFSNDYKPDLTKYPKEIKDFVKERLGKENGKK